MWHRCGKLQVGNTCHGGRQKEGHPNRKCRKGKAWGQKKKLYGNAAGKQSANGTRTWEQKHAGRQEPPPNLLSQNVQMHESSGRYKGSKMARGKAQAGRMKNLQAKAQGRATGTNNSQIKVSVQGSKQYVKEGRIQQGKGNVGGKCWEAWHVVVRAIQRPGKRQGRCGQGEGKVKV